MEERKPEIISLFDAPIVIAKVIDRDTFEVLYNGDSLYESNKVYASAIKEGRHVKSEYSKKRLVEEKEASRLNKKNLPPLSEMQQYLNKLPQRIADIYMAILGGCQIDVETYDIARKFHPEYFGVALNKNKIQKLIHEPESKGQS